MKIRFKAKMFGNVNLLIVIKIVAKDLLVTFEREKPSVIQSYYLEMQPMPQRDNESRSDTDRVQSLNHPDRVSDAQEPSEREFTWMVDEREKVQF